MYLSSVETIYVRVELVLVFICWLMFDTADCFSILLLEPSENKLEDNPYPRRLSAPVQEESPIPAGKQEPRTTFHTEPAQGPARQTWNLGAGWILDRQDKVTLLRCGKKEYHLQLERFPLECRKTETKVITTTNHKKRKYL